MSKRSQTTGQPKASRPASKVYNAPEQPKTIRDRLLPETQTKAERDHAIQRLVILVTSIVVGIAAVILIVAIAYDQFVVPRQAVATVNGSTITVADFRQRVLLERFLVIQQYNNAIGLFQSFGLDDQSIAQQLQQEPYATWYNEVTVPDQLGNRVINTLVEDELVRQEAAARGITVSQEEIQERIQEFFGYDPNELFTTPTATVTPTLTPTPLVSPTASPVPTETLVPTETPVPVEATDDPNAPTAEPTATDFPTATPSPTPDATQRAETFNTNRNDFFGAIRAETGLGDADMNRYFEMQVLRKKLGDALTAEMGDTTTYYNVRHILVATQEEAQSVVNALNAGESFADLAAAVSTDTSNSVNGGELGWAPATQYVAPFAEAVENAEIGAVVGPVQTEFGWHVLQVRGREERPISEQERENLQARELEEFIDNKRAAEADNIEIFELWTDNIPS
jgi:parvulin-like peptidyl-prolyl isomerase